MLLVKFTAADLKLFDRAKSQAEIEGALALVRDRIAQYKLLKEFGKVPSEKAETFGWKHALEVCEEVLGKEGVFKPPFPDYRWFQRINGVLKSHGMGPDRVREIAEYAKENCRTPISFDFLICQHRRIMDGEFNNKAAQPRRDKLDWNGRGDGFTQRSIGPELPEE